MDDFFKHLSSKIIYLVFACLLPVIVTGTSVDEIDEKRKFVVMRMIGHELLACMGDLESRVLPIEKVDQYDEFDSYRVSFETEFEADPDDIASIISQVMMETGIAHSYFVQVEQCETKQVVHSFEVRNPAYAVLIACSGRVLPKDCYDFLITIINDKSLAENSPVKKANYFKVALIIVLLLNLIGFARYFIRKRKSTLSDRRPVDHNLDLTPIGDSQFDKRNMVLSFEDNRVELSHKESELLALLHASANEPIEREVLLEKVWGDEGDYVGRTLDVFISKLRKKLKADKSLKIVNIRGIGYKLIVSN